MGGDNVNFLGIILLSKWGHYFKNENGKIINS